MEMTDTAHLDELRRRFNAGEKMEFLHFWGHQARRDGGIGKSCFSQWYPASFDIAGLRYGSAEHYMMAAKARLFGDDATLAQILQASTPSEAKAKGRLVAGFDDAAWCEHRFQIVCDANEAKFGQNPALRQFLLDSGNKILVEASPPDRIWGIGLAEDDKDAGDPNSWRGLNLLGFALMATRNRLG